MADELAEELARMRPPASGLVPPEAMSVVAVFRELGEWGAWLSDVIEGGGSVRDALGHVDWPRISELTVELGGQARMLRPGRGMPHEDVPPRVRT